MKAITGSVLNSANKCLFVLCNLQRVVWVEEAGGAMEGFFYIILQLLI
jgi:hypothetical protein